MDNRKHWETVYETKQPAEVSWTQEIPQTSLDIIHGLNLTKEASIIDVGGGDSKLVDFLIDEGFKNITVLDISEKSLARAKSRLKEKAENVTWIVSDITVFKPQTKYDLWHDRATFHFLTSSEQIKKYVDIINNNVENYLVIGTFSKDGPKKCSGLNIKQYSEKLLENLLSDNFEKIYCKNEEHITPFNTPQNFLFCSFKKLK